MHLIFRNADKLFVRIPKRYAFVIPSICSFCSSISRNNQHQEKCPPQILDENEILVSLTSKISSLVRRNQPEQAIGLFRRMFMSDQRPNFVTAVSIIRAVGDVGVESMAQEFHGLVIKIGFELEIPVVTALLGVYSIWDMGTVWKLFGEVRFRDVVLWSAMVSTFARNGWHKEALECFRGMRVDRVEPNSVSVASVLPACADLGALQFGKQIHGFCIRKQMCSHKNVQNSLVDMYAKCKKLQASIRVFHRISDKDIVSWRSVIHGCIENGHLEKALSIFVCMQSVGFSPDENIILEVIRATLLAEKIKFGLGFHCLLLKTGYLRSISIATALFQMYGKLGKVASARILFNHVHQKDFIAYSAMISTYAQSGDTYNAFDTFKLMQLANEKPNEITFIALLQASSSLAAEEIGESIHAYATKAGYVSNTYLASALIDLYCKCGRIRQAKLLFSETPRRDLICWSSMISGYGKNGYGTEAVKTFTDMLRCGIKPNDVVFISILSSCSQCGLKSEGWKWFHAMKEKYGISPKLAHYACMVDLLSHSGNIEEGLEFVKTMPIEPDERIWGALLAGCRKVHGSHVIAEIAAQRLIDLDPENISYYAFLSNLYSEQSRWEDAETVKQLVNKKGLRNDMGYSMIEACL